MSDAGPPLHADDLLIEAAARQARAAAAGVARFGRAEKAFVDLSAPPPRPGTDGAALGTLAGYDLLVERHRGGQGVVYEALQRATKRKVAVKVLYDGPQAGPTRRLRFAREVEILSQLRHPNIVTVHDSGETGGRFFYVMDLVRGVPLDRWFERRWAGRAEADWASRAAVRGECEHTLRLFTKICDAINAAHLRGVIHRDLKPGNILIDGAGEPHVLDFGLAKLTYGLPDGQSNAPPVTRTGQFVGSLPWSSPEQAAGRPEDVDMRTDVYALGVLLYHALTGQFPYRVDGSVADTLQRIREAEPKPLNAAFRETMEKVGFRRRVGACFDSELETIVRTCLQKDRTRRYQTAGDLGRDLQRYLAGEPISAKRDSFAYVLCKQLHKHRWPVVSVGAIFVASVLGLIVSLTFWWEAERQRAIAQQERDHARAAEQVAARGQAEAETVRTLLEELLGAADANEPPGPGLTLRELLDQFSETSLTRLSDQPAVELRLRTTVCNGYFNLGAFAQAQEHAARALELARHLHGDGSPEVSAALNRYGRVLAAQGDHDAAQRLFDQARGRLRAGASLSGGPR